MAYILGILKGLLNGDHFMVSICLGLMGLMMTGIVMLFKESRQRAIELAEKDKLIKSAYDQLASLNEKYSDSSGKSADNALKMAEGLGDLMRMFHDIIREKI